MSQPRHKWSSDREGRVPADDKLDRLNFAQRVAKDLGAWRDKDSLVVSLNGDWGSGKTTLINLVLHYLDQQAKRAGETPPVVVQFNPWHWSGQDLLFEAFFDEIGDALGRESPGTRGAELAKKWKLFGALSRVGKVTAQVAETGANAVAVASMAASQPAVAATAVAGAGISGWLKRAFSGSETIATVASDAHDVHRTKTLSEVRVELKALLKEMPAPLIVVIDDIDRLTKEQVRMLVQLVKANADFANVVYVLLFQRNVVASALDEVCCERGKDFLKKIIQVELEVPAAPDHKMREMLGQGLDDIWKRVRLRWDTERWERWRTLFEDAVWPYFQTPRDVKRFLGSFDFYFEAHTDGDILNVNPVDLVLLETLRIFDPEAYDAVGKAFQKGRNAFVEILFGDREARANFALGIDHLVDERKLSEKEKKRLRALLYGLFPQASENGRDSSNHDAWDRDFRICHQRHFPKYFQLSENPGEVSAKFIAQFFEENDRAKCRELLQTAIDQGQFKATMERLWVMSEDLPEKQVEPMLGAFLDMTDCLPDLRTGVGFSGDGERELCRLAHRLLGRIEDQAQRDEIFFRVVETTSALNGPVFLTGYLEAKAKEHSSEGLVSLDSLGKAKAILTPRIWERTKEPSFWDLRLAALIIYRLKDWEGIELVRTWLDQCTREPDVAQKFFGHMLNEMHESSGGRTVVKHVLRAEELEKFIGLELLHSRLPLKALDRVEAVAAEKLEQAVKLKSEGKRYSEIFVLAFDEDGNESTNPRDQSL